MAFGHNADARYSKFHTYQLYASNFHFNPSYNESSFVTTTTTRRLRQKMNALVYFRPRYESIRAKHRTESKMSNWFRVLRLPIPSVENCGCCFRVNGGDTGGTCNNQSSPSSLRAQNIMRKEGTEHEDKEGDRRGGSSIDETISGTNMDHSHLQHEYVDNVADKA